MTLRNDIRRPESSPHRVVLAFLARFLLRRRYLILSTIALVYLSTLAILADRQNLDVNNHQPNLYGQKRKNKEARIGGRSECTFCDGERGIPDLDLVLPQAGGNTCRSIKSMAAREMKGSDTCAILQKEERVCCPPPYSPPKTIFVISLQGTPGAHESNNGRLDLFKEKWRMACGSSSDSTNIEHCPAAVDKRRGYGLTLTWMMCLWRARQLDEEVAIFLEDDARLFANSTQEFCDVDKRGKLLSKLPSDTFVAWLGGHTWSYEDPISTAPYRRVRNSYGTYGFLVPRNSIDDFHAALKDGLINGSKDRKQNVHHNSLDPEPNFYRAAREHKKKMYAFNPLVIWHEGGYSNTWGKVRGDITGIETGRHGIKVGSGMANTNKRKRIDSNHQQEGHRSIPTISTKDRENAILGHRITPLDSTKKFSFVHIAKCAGATWMRLLKSVLKLDASPKKETGDEFSVFYHKNYCCKDADYTLISLRSPRHHVWSQFTMCKYSPWGLEITKGRTEFPRSGNEYEDDEVDFHSWLSHFVSMGNKTNDDLNCYHPLSMQTRALTSKVRYPFLPYFRGGGAELSPNMTLAMNTYKDLDFVALVEFVHESECMLYYRLGNKAPPVALSYLSQSCHCETQQVDHKDGNGIVNVQHHNMGKRTNLRDLPPATLSKVDNFISADSIVYVNALKHFMDEMAWLESNNALGRRVVCDDVLKKWEPELAYLDDGRFSVTQMYRAAITKIQQIDSKPECLFCDGERVIPDLDLVVPQTGGNTCRSIKKLADGEMRGSATCVILQKEERVCCPVVYEKALSLVEPISNQNDEQSKLLVPFKEGDHVVYDKRNELRLAEIVDVVNEKSKITLKYFKPHSSTASEETIEYREGLLHEHSEALRFQTGTFANCAFDYVENNTLHFTKPNDKSANVSCKRIRFAAEAGSFVGKSGVIVGVLSTSENFRWRNVIRSTWAAESTVFFVIAGSWDDIEEEYHRYKDIIWIDMEDSFRLITYKTSMFFQVVNMMASELNLTYSHALKTDDDSYVAIGRLEQLVKEEKPTTIDYWGYSQMKYVKPLRNLKSRYYVSLDQYPEPYYPPYVAGAAILLSHKTVECVTDEMQNARFLDMEDAFIGIVTARCGVIPTHSELVKVYRGSVGLSRWTTTGNKTLHVTMKGKIIQHRILNLEDMMAHHESIKTSLANTNESNRHRMWSGTFSSLVYISFFSTMCAFFFFLRQE